MHPFIVFFGLQIPTYGIMMVIGCMLSVLLSLRRCERYGCSKDNTIIIMACIGGMAIIGAKLLYLLVSVSFMDLIEAIKAGQLTLVLEGGQIFYGGALGGIIGALIGLRITHTKANAYILTILPTIPLGHAAGRVGCFLAGCCYGIPYKGAFSVVYRNPVGGAPVDIPLFPVQCLESLVNILIFLVLLRISKKTSSGIRLALIYIGLYSFARFILEYFRYDAIRGGAWLFSTAQWISLALILTALLTLFFTNKLSTGYEKKS